MSGEATFKTTGPSIVFCASIASSQLCVRNSLLAGIPAALRIDFASNSEIFFSKRASLFPLVEGITFCFPCLKTSAKYLSAAMALTASEWSSKHG